MPQVEAVVRRVRHLTERDPGTKVLVFSTWQDLLDVVAHALAVNAVPFAASKGRGFTQSVRDFQAGALQGQLGGKRARLHPAGPIQTLLLPVKHGSNGLNLTGGALRRCGCDGSWGCCMGEGCPRCNSLAVPGWPHAHARASADAGGMLSR